MRIKNILLGLGIISITCFSCDDYLEEENLSNVTADSFYTTANGYNSLINVNYAKLKDIYGGDAWLFSAGTDLYAEGRDQEPPGLSRYTQLTSSSQGVGQLYTTCYQAIQSANMAIYYSDLTEQTPNLSQQLGEVKYLRANAYFLLVQTYGGVGLVTDYIDSPVLTFDRNSAEEVYSFIVSELEESLTMVGSGAFDGHVNKRAVQHLLAKVHLTRGYESFAASDDFSKAASYADDAINGQALTIPFEELWAPGNEMNAETIFSVQYDETSNSSDPTNIGNKQNYYFSSYLGGAEVADNAPYRSYTLCPTAFAVSLFDEGDERWEGTFMTEAFQKYYDYFRVEDHSGLEVAHYYAPKWASTTADTTAYRLDHPNTTIHAYGEYVPSENRNFDYETIPVKKFDDPKSPFSSNGGSTRDIILSRLADTYLIAAEAYFQNGNAGTALARLNAVRERANATPATAADMDIDYILDERARELLGEYHRWFDLKRTGKLVERASMYHYLIDEGNFVGANGELKILRPIPQEAIDLNQNKDFPQNTAYE
ncbi:RagB/SusD family nutrient uptake outer membrane protein [Galbibacter pacificus]|uniref:RagB/SusD family nutrient uptake outer membrane protein n=1 Tax=Galbibacter pacificus TaxID=2996052 RepID=A0ABT6FP73_9FLAO|nr:RagB/SusD family nutrient uptake outer membrane protein [Galbibacter pacificus]MDG3581587.1 RagB/SusD family nutrient uptake outer membrane protein [Galbibacter pacificus]MDG3585065.1 RagB/SusD family nutrient uptake outer membrane protein [Galbibacter pacificus]